ncbi:MAG: hypothetical protein H6710_22600 [Myxococcales bacterium]|nr:hypothetical protein [Myxococcales bacterium]
MSAGPPVDPRTAARAEALRAGSALPIRRIHGSLVGRPGGPLWDVAIEPGGRHAAVLVRGAVERWDLDALECVGRWPLPRDLWPMSVICVGEVPAGLRFLGGWELWRGLEAAAPISVRTREGGLSIRSSDPPTRSIVQMVDGEVPVLVRVADGAPLCEVPEGQRRWCDPEGRWLVVERSRTSFDVFAVVEGDRTPRFVQALTVDEALVGEAQVVVDGEGRRVALVFEEVAVIGAWERWSAARAFPVPALPWTAHEFCGEGRTLVLCAPGSVVRLDPRRGRTSEARFDADEPCAFDLDVATGRVLFADAAGLRVIDGAAVRTRIRDHGPLVVAIAATPELLVTSGSDGSIRVRERASGEVRSQLQCPTREPHQVAVTADQVIAVGDADGLLRWSLKTGQPRPRVALRRTSNPAAQRLLLAPDGRHVVVGRGGVWHESFEATVVDLAAGGARQLERIDMMHRRVGALCLGLDPAGVRLRGATLTEYSQRIELWSRPLAGGPRERLGASRSVGGRPLAVSSDGRWLWWEDVNGREVSVTEAAAEVAAAPLARFSVAGKVVASCVGRSLLAVAVAGDLTILSVDGRSLATGFPDECAPLAFAADERALWVRDEAGLVLELTIPESI